MGATDNQTKVILVVDDNIDAREVFMLCLESAGYRVLQAKDGVEALQVLAGNFVDAVLTDMKMPNMDGARLAAEMKNNPAWSAIPIGLVSATPHATEGDFGHFSRILIKPCSMDDLIGMARYLLALPAASAAVRYL